MSDIHRTTFEQYLRGIDEGRYAQERSAAHSSHLQTCPDCRFDFHLYDKLQAEAALTWPASLLPQRSSQEMIAAINDRLNRDRRQQRITSPLTMVAWAVIILLLLIVFNWVLSSLRVQPAEPPTPTPDFAIVPPPDSPDQTPQVSDLDFTKVPVQPLVTGQDIGGWRNWSPDGVYFFFTLVEAAEDPQSDRVYTSVNFLNVETGEVCRHPDQHLGYYGSNQVHWLPDSRLLIVTESQGLQIYIPCQDEIESIGNRIPETVYPIFTSGRESGAFFLLQGEAHYWLLERDTLQARRLEEPAPGPERTDRQVWSPSGAQVSIIQSAGEGEAREDILTIVAADSGRVVHRIRLPNASEYGPPSAEWLLEDKIFVWSFNETGPLLVDLVGGQPRIISVKQELLGLDISIPDEVHGTAYMADQTSGNFFIALRTNKPGVDALLIYYSETGEVKRWQEDGHYYLFFPGDQFVFLNRWEDEPNYTDEFIMIWVAEPERSPQRLVVAGHTPRNYNLLWPRLLPGGDRLAFGSSQGVSLASLPDGQLLNFWSLESERDPMPSLYTSPDGRYIVVTAMIPKEDFTRPDSALYLIRVEP
jgi:hypothetical protein